MTAVLVQAALASLSDDDAVTFLEVGLLLPVPQHYPTIFFSKQPEQSCKTPRDHISPVQNSPRTSSLI